MRLVQSRHSTDVRVETHATGTEVNVVRHPVMPATSMRQKQYPGNIATMIGEASSIEQVDEYLAVAKRDCTADTRTRHRWEITAAFRRVALAETREQAFSLALEGSKILDAAGTVRITEACERRLDQLAKRTSVALVDPNGKPLSATA